MPNENTIVNYCQSMYQSRLFILLLSKAIYLIKHIKMNALKNLQPFIPEYMRDYYLSYKYSKQRKTWMKNGCPLPTPHIIKQLAIKSYQEKYDVEILVETGTYLGDMVYAQRKSFKRIYTIELSEKLYHYSKKRLNKYSNIKVIQGDSSIALDSIIKEINEPSIFWLDGHYSGGITAKGNSNCPILM